MNSPSRPLVYTVQLYPCEQRCTTTQAFIRPRNRDLFYAIPLRSLGKRKPLSNDDHVDFLDLVSRNLIRAAILITLKQYADHYILYMRTVRSMQIVEVLRYRSAALRSSPHRNAG